MNLPPSELAWTSVHFQAAGAEVPARLAHNTVATEGQIMPDEELEQFITDSIATLRILADHNSPRYNAVRLTFDADILYLKNLGRISIDDYNGLTNPDNLHF
jgi:hypothetical protein